MRENAEAGFSLLELTVATLLTVGLLGVVFSITSRNQQVFVTEYGVVDMNQNARTVADLVTRDIQSAGMGLPVGGGNFAAIYYKNGASKGPDSIMMVNGDPFAPAADVVSRNDSNSEFLMMQPPDVGKITTSTSTQFTYINGKGQTTSVYRNYSTDARKYIVYDETNAMIFTLRANASITGSGGSERISLLYTKSSFLSPASSFGSAVDTAQPANYDNSRIAILANTVAYKLDTATDELLRTEDLQNWYVIARGIIDFQVQYRVLLRNNTTGKIEEKVTDTPGNGTDATSSGLLTLRRDIRSIIITITAETPDVPPGTPSYRRATHRLEVAPRNLNLINNNSLRAA